MTNLIQINVHEEILKRLFQIVSRRSEPFVTPFMTNDT